MKTIALVCTGLLLSVRVFSATPIHHYTFNGPGVVDSVGAVDGTLLNGATNVQGMLTLDGVDDYVQFGVPLIPVAGGFSVAFFARELAPPSSDRMEMISQGCSYCPGFYIGYYPSPMMRVGDEWQNTGIPFPNDGLIHHYAVTVDDQQTRLYIDGSLMATHPPIHLTAGGGDATRLGMQFQSWGENFHGNIDELWVFSGALTETEVKTLAAGQELPPVPPVPATPIHHYTFNGPGVVDSVGSADGTLLNGATNVQGMLTLDGVDDYVQFGVPLIPSVGGFSVALFAQELSPPSSDRMEMISQGCSYCPGFYIGYYPSPMMRVGDEWQNTGIPFPSDGLFHHYTVTVDDQRTRLYIDGSLMATNRPINLTAGGDATRLGMQFQSWGENFHGNIDELWVFSGALTETEVKTLAATNVPVNVAGLIAQVKKSVLSAQDSRPLLATLTAAQVSFTSGGCETGIAELNAFQNKVRAQLGRQNAALANALTATAQSIIDKGCS